MRKLLILFLLVSQFAFGQKALTYTKGLIFNEPFTDSISVVANGGVPTDVTFSNGVATIDRDASALLQYTKINNLSGVYSFRIRFKINEFQTSADDPYLFDFRGTGAAGTGSAYINDNGDQTVIASSGTIYRDGIAQTTVPLIDTWYEVVISGVTINAIGVPSYSIGTFALSPNTQRADWDIDLIEIYNYALTAEEVSTLYTKGTLRKVLTFAGEVMTQD